MSAINGYDNEYEFVKYLNNRRIGDLNPMFKELIVNLYDCVDESLVIFAWKNHLPQKSDVFVKINGIIKGISIKKGMKNSVHVEGISDFISFLIINNVPKKIIIEYLKYHYADGTTNGSGRKRLSANEYKKDNQKNIDEINAYFNEPVLLNNAIERFILTGNNSDYSIDVLICGEVYDFIWILKDDIKRLIMQKRDVYSTAVHFGPITCQPKNRCLNYNPLYEKERFCVQLKWYNLYDEIIEVMNSNILGAGL